MAPPAEPTSLGRRGPLSVHFDARELWCRHCRACFVVDELVQLLEEIRRHHGGPLVPIDGYRCPVHNRAVGGAQDSQHVYGTAADLPPQIVTPPQAFTLGARGVGSKNGWAVHVDVRRGRRAQWVY